MNKELIQKDKEEKAIKFYKNYIENQEKELDWMYKQNEEYYRDEIEQKELLIKGFRTILNLIQKQEKIIDEMKLQIYQMAKYISYLDIEEDICVKNVTNPQLCNEEYINCIECIKEYFKKECESDEI